jgi:8-oxo-dGTP pyrophosphatase MutT (NUDIX family)
MHWRDGRLIRVISICVFNDNGRILVAEGIDSVTRDRFARPLGGGVEPGETSRQAVTREIREELGLNAIELRLLGVLENIFEYQGKPGHEIAFVYDGRLDDPSAYERPELPMSEPGWDSPAKWRSLDSFGDDCRLVPEDLITLLRQPTDAHAPPALGPRHSFFGMLALIMAGVTILWLGYIHPFGTPHYLVRDPLWVTLYENFQWPGYIGLGLAVVGLIQSRRKRILNIIAIIIIVLEYVLLFPPFNFA